MIILVIKIVFDHCCHHIVNTNYCCYYCDEKITKIKVSSENFYKLNAA